MKTIIDGISYKVWKLPHPVLLHWVLNPGLVINELLLGQRLPKVTLLKEGPEPMHERSYISCPSCDTLHHGILWGKKSGFGHHNGLYCPTCEAKIPQLLNVFSILLLIITFPLWKPLQMIFGERVKARSLRVLRMAQHNAQDITTQPVDFVQMGVLFGIAMGVVTMFQLGVMKGPTVANVSGGLIGGVFAGVAFGFIMWLVMRGKNAKS